MNWLSSFIISLKASWKQFFCKHDWKTSSGETLSPDPSMLTEGVTSTYCIAQCHCPKCGKVEERGSDVLVA